MAESHCWCQSVSFPRDCGVTVESGLEPEESRFWHLVLLCDIDPGQVDPLVADISMYLPPDVWYFGSREDHLVELATIDPVTGEEYERPSVHSCMSVLFASASLLEVRTVVEALGKVILPGSVARIDSLSCPSHVTGDGTDLNFKAVHEWVARAIEFVGAIGAVRNPAGLRQGIIGYPGILSVLKFQFGPASDCIAEEMVLAKQCSDEEDGLLVSSPGGFDLCRVPVGGEETVIYVRSVKRTRRDGLSIDDVVAV